MKQIFLSISYILLSLPNYLIAQNRITPINRDQNSRKDFANVYYKKQYTLFDMWSDEPIFPDNNFIYNIYIASNENKKPQAYSGTAWDLEDLHFYKFKNYSNCKKWCDGVVYQKTKSSSSTSAHKPVSVKKPENNGKKCIWCGSRFTDLGYSIYYNGEIIRGTIKDYAVFGNYPGDYCTKKCAIQDKIH